MERRAFLAGTVAVLLAAPLGEVQPSGQVWRVGLLDFAAPDAARVAWWMAFRERLRELGYVEGQNYRDTQPRPWPTLLHSRASTPAEPMMRKSR